MITSIRQLYNSHFSTAQYEAFIRQIHQDFPNQLEFRVAETPIFLDNDFRQKIVNACEDIIDVIVKPDFKAKTAKAMPQNQIVPNEDEHTTFLACDFAICMDKDGSLSPQLIELQGFPSIFGFQPYLVEMYRKFFKIPENFTPYFGGLQQADYWEELRKVIIGDSKVENTILLEIYPEKQKTRIDFAVTQKYLGIRPVCLTKVKKAGKNLYYEHEGKKIDIERIYNRLIFDDLNNFPDLQTEFNFSDEISAQWVGHPNWFFRISKYTLPFLKGDFVPESHFLSDLSSYPSDLENYVLKPLFSFAGAGVQLHIQAEDLDKIQDRENYLIQRKVQYEPVIQALDGKVKAEVRMLYIWHPSAPRPRLVVNLSRLSRGEMIGVRFNQNKDWVGGSVCLFES
jgi:hypothetical protein